VLDDLRRLPDDRIVVAEGFRLLPRLVRPHLSSPWHGVWLLPVPAFRRAAFARRGPGDAFWARTTDPDRALANLLERDGLFTVELAGEVARSGLDAVRVDGGRSADRMAQDLAHRFGLEPTGTA
jgi:hypothetical protein